MYRRGKGVCINFKKHLERVLYFFTLLFKIFLFCKLNNITHILTFNENIEK